MALTLWEYYLLAKLTWACFKMTWFFFSFDVDGLYTKVSNFIFGPTVWLVIRLIARTQVIVIYILAIRCKRTINFFGDLRCV